ncbi:MAG: ankyrin repeat domain-containing protein [Pseudomonadota bacterium]
MQMKPRSLPVSLALAGLLATAGAALSANTLPAPTGLVEAVQGGDVAAVRTLLRQKASVNEAEGDGSTALHWAAHDDKLAIAKLLLSAHADANAVTRNGGLTPLLLACETGDAAMINLLIDHGANPRQANALGTTPLMVAAASGSAKAVDALVAHGVDPNEREKVHGQTALMFAANLNRAEAIHALLVHGADANAASTVVPATSYTRSRPGNNNNNDADKTDDDAAPPKDAPAKDPAAKDGAPARPANRRPGPAAGTSPTTEIAASASDNVGNNGGGGGNNAAAAAQRRDRGNASKMGGLTPLHYAARQGNVEATRALIEGGAKMDIQSGSEQTTPLVLAIANGHYDVAKVLVEHGADVNKANIMGLAPLYAVIDVQWVPKQWSPEPLVDQEHTDYLTLMKLLIDHGANVNAKLGRTMWFRTLTENRHWTDAAGSTAFWRAAWADDMKAMQLLKAAGADVTIASDNDTTPLMVAAGIGWGANYSATAPTRMEAVKYLMGMGADVNHQDKQGFTALHGAGFVGNLELIQYLVDSGAKTDVKSKAGDYPADSANGPFEKSLPNPEAVVLLEKLGSPNSHNCRSSDCVPPLKEEKAVANDGKPGATPVAPASPAAPVTKAKLQPAG